MGKKSPKATMSGASGQHAAAIPRPRQGDECEYTQLIADGSVFGTGLAGLARQAKTSDTCQFADKPAEVVIYGGNRTGQFCDKHGQLVETYDIMIQSVMHRPEVLSEDRITRVEVDGTPYSKNIYDIQLSDEELGGTAPYATAAWSSSLMRLRASEPIPPCLHTWQTAWFNESGINAFGGRQITRAGEYMLSFYVFGFVDEGKVACLLFPMLQKQVEVPATMLTGTDNTSWQPAALLSSMRKSPTFLDGRDSNGVSMFFMEPSEDLSACFSRMEGDEPAVPFISSPRRSPAPVLSPAVTRSASQAKQAKEVKEHLTATVAGMDSASQRWAEHLAQIGEMSNVTSPGKPLSHVGILEDLLTTADPAVERCVGCNKRRIGSQLTACSCGRLPPRTATITTEARIGSVNTKPKTSMQPPLSHYEQFLNRTGLNDSQEVRYVYEQQGRAENKQVSFAASRVAAKAHEGGHQPKLQFNTAVSEDQREPEVISSDDSQDDDPEANDFLNDPVIAKKVLPTARYLQKQLIAGLLRLDSNRGMVAAVKAEKLAIAVFEAATEMLEKSQARSEAFHVQQALEVKQHNEQLMLTNTALKDKEAERRKNKEKFIHGSAECIKYMREAGRGDHGDQTGCTGRGSWPQIGVGLVDAELYLAIMESLHNQDTKSSYQCLMSPATIYNLVSFGLGGASRAEDPSNSVLVYAGNTSIYDFLRKANTKADTVTHFYESTSVPKKEAMKHKLDAVRDSEVFANIEALVKAWIQQGVIWAMLFGSRWYDVCERCAENLRELYEKDSDMYSVDKLKRLSDVGIYHMAVSVRRMSANPELLPSAYESKLARTFGFSLHTPLPGMCFEEGSPFVRDNLHLPFQADVLTALQTVLVGLTPVERSRVTFSSLKYALPAKATLLLGEAAMDLDPLESGWECSDCAIEEVIGWSEEEPIDTENDPIHSWLLGGERAVRIEAERNKGPGKSHGKGVRPTGATGRGKGSRVLRAPRIQISIPHHYMKEAYNNMPRSLDAQGGDLGAICFPWMCNGPKGSASPSACRSHPEHPDHTPGALKCSRSHGNPGPGLTWIHFALALGFGGLRKELVETLPPTDLIALQKMGAKAVAAHRNNIPVPRAFVDHAFLGESALDAEWYLPLGASAQAEIFPTDWHLGGTMVSDSMSIEEEVVIVTAELALVETQLASILCGQPLLGGQGEPDSAPISVAESLHFNTADVWIGSVQTPFDHYEFARDDTKLYKPGDVYRTGSIVIRGFALALRVEDFLGRLPGREGRQSCFFLTMGRVLRPFGWTPILYWSQTCLELARGDVASKFKADYAIYTPQVRGTGMVELKLLCVSGMPKGVAMLVVRLLPDSSAVTLTIFTCGNPTHVVAGYIEGQHIMAAHFQTAPLGGVMRWKDFEPAFKQWCADPINHWTVVHTARTIACLTQSTFGKGPDGDKMRLGGEMTNGGGELRESNVSQCEVLHVKLGMMMQTDEDATCEVKKQKGSIMQEGSAVNTPQVNEWKDASGVKLTSKMLKTPTSVGGYAVQVNEAGEKTWCVYTTENMYSTPTGNAEQDARRTSEIGLEENDRRNKRQAKRQETAREVWEVIDLVSSVSKSPSTHRDGYIGETPSPLNDILGQREQAGKVTEHQEMLQVSPSAAINEMIPTGAVTLVERKDLLATEREESIMLGSSEKVEELLDRWTHLQARLQALTGENLNHNFEDTSELVQTSEQGKKAEESRGELVAKACAIQVGATDELGRKEPTEVRVVEQVTDTAVKEKVARMLQPDSVEVLALLPFVKSVQAAIRELYTAIKSEVVVGAERRKVLQQSYLKATNNMCHETVRLCPYEWWPQLFLYAFRSTHPGRVDPDVDPVAMRIGFEGLIDADLLEEIIRQATVGQEIHMHQNTEASWAKETPTVKEFLEEIWRTIWIDVAHQSSFVFGPECLKYMILAKIQGYALHRIPKKSTVTGLPTGKGRLIADLSHEDKDGYSINSLTWAELYGTFHMARHSDIARQVLLLRSWFPELIILIIKFDASRAFRRKWVAVESFGKLATQIKGHAMLDASYIFGLNIAPRIYSSSSRAIDQAHNASSVWLSGEALRNCKYAGFEAMTPEEQQAGMWIPCLSSTYCDDGMVLGFECQEYLKETARIYKHFMCLNLGPDAVSDKDMQEQTWEERKTVMGHLLSLNNPPDVRMDKDFLAPTAERIKLMLHYMRDPQLSPDGKESLTAGLCMRMFSLWLWMCIPCPRLKSFIGSFKRALEGRVHGSSIDIVTPVREGDNPGVAWSQFWDDMNTLTAMLMMSEEHPNMFRVPLFRLLTPEEQLLNYSDRFDIIATDASKLGGGIICLKGKRAGCFGRLKFPLRVTADIEECMRAGYTEGDTTLYTIAIAEQAMQTLGLMLLGERGGCYLMKQDNQNVVNWVSKGWGKPLRAQFYLRLDMLYGAHLDTWAIIEYIHTSLNVEADLLSRSFDETGNTLPLVMEEFSQAVQARGLVATEIVIPASIVECLFPPAVIACKSSQLLHEVKMLAAEIEKESKISPKIGDSSECGQGRWKSAKDSCSHEGEDREELLIGGGRQSQGSNSKSIPPKVPMIIDAEKDLGDAVVIDTPQVEATFLNADLGFKKMHMIDSANRHLSINKLHAASREENLVGAWQWRKHAGSKVCRSWYVHSWSPICQSRWSHRRKNPLSAYADSKRYRSKYAYEPNLLGYNRRVKILEKDALERLFWKTLGEAELGGQGRWRSDKDSCSHGEGEIDELHIGGGSQRPAAATGQIPFTRKQTSGRGLNRYQELSDAQDSEKEVFEVEKIIKERNHALNGKQFKVKWLGYGHSSNCWKRRDELTHCAELVTDFEMLVCKYGTTHAEMTDIEAENFYYPEATRIKNRNEIIINNQPSWREQENDPSQTVWEPRYVAQAKGQDKPRTGYKGRGKNDSEQSYNNRVLGRPETIRERNWTFQPASGGFNRTIENDFMGKSLGVLTAGTKERQNRRVEEVITVDDNRLKIASAQTLASSLAKNTHRSYFNNYLLYLEFCERQQLSPVLNSLDKRNDEAKIISWIMYEYAVHKNRYATLKAKLYALRYAIMDDGYPDPLLNKHLLDKHMKGIKALRGATEAKEPLPIASFRDILLNSLGRSMRVQATAIAITVGLFWLLRISEFAKRGENEMTSFIIKRKDVSFFKKGKLCPWYEPDVDAVELFIPGSKTDQANQGTRRMQYATGEAEFCPVKCMVRWFAMTDGSAIPPAAPLFSIPLGTHGEEWVVLSRTMVVNVIKSAATECNLPTKLASTHSIRISGATALLLAGVPAETVQIIGRWVSNVFQRYTRFKAEIMQGVSAAMARTGFAVNSK